MCATLLRLACHFVSGWIIWEALWPNELGWASPLWSLAYNASYMIPEMIITTVAAVAPVLPAEEVLLRRGPEVSQKAAPRPPARCFR